MPPSKVKIEFCTSCGSNNIKVTGNIYYCPDCDITYKVTDQGTKVFDSNPLFKTNVRIDKIEQDIITIKGGDGPGPGPAKVAGQAEPAEPASVVEDEEGDNESDGFISIEG